MLPVKSEQCDSLDVGKDSQHIRCLDDNQHTHTSDNRPDKSLSYEMLLTVACVKN